MQGIVGCFLVACLVCWSVFGRDVDPDSLEYRLSKLFSDITVPDRQGVTFRMLEGTVGFRLRQTDADVRDPKRLKGGASVLLSPNERMNFSAVFLDSSLSVTLTNELVNVRSNSGFVEGDGLYLLFQWQTFASARTGVKEQKRQFAVDIPKGLAYDFEKKTSTSFELPFHSIWKDWDDYQENYTGKPKVDEVARLRHLADVVKDNLLQDTLTGKAFRNFCKGLPNGVPTVVLYRRSAMMGGDAIFHLAHVRPREDGVEVLGHAVFCPSVHTMADRIVTFDQEGKLAWSCTFIKPRQARTTPDQYGEFYEFDASGDVRRFVELDGDGRELPRRLRRLKDREMVKPEERSAFYADMNEAIRPLAEAWKTHSYRVAPERKERTEVPQVKTPEVVLKYEREKREILSRANRERTAKGLAPLTKQEEGLVLRQKFYEDERVWFERIRHEMTGRTQSTARDVQMDLERVRVSNLYRVLYRISRETGGVYPKTLQEVVGRTSSRMEGPLLLGGEADLRDLWGHAYRYSIGQGKKIKMKHDHPVIVSAGPDGVFDTEDDLSSDDYLIYQRYDFQKKGVWPKD